MCHMPLPHGAAHPAVTWLEAPFSSPLCWPELRDCHSAVRAARRLKGSSEHDAGGIMLLARCHCLLSSAGAVPILHKRHCTILLLHLRYPFKTRSNSVKCYSRSWCSSQLVAVLRPACSMRVLWLGSLLQGRPE